MINFFRGRVEERFNVMLKYKVIFLCITIACVAHAQTDSSKKIGTIKIVKPKNDSVYMKAVMNFNYFQEGNKNNTQPLTYPLNQVVVPFPKNVDPAIPFDYTKFLNKFLEIKRSDLESKITDTVYIQIKILDNGKAYYKDLTPLLMLNGVPAYYDTKKNAYKLDAIHWKCLHSLQYIKEWEPAYVIKGVKGKFKNTPVIKPKKKKLMSLGTLTIIFSTLPFE